MKRSPYMQGLLDGEEKYLASRPVERLSLYTPYIGAIINKSSQYLSGFVDGYNHHKQLAERLK